MFVLLATTPPAPAPAADPGIVLGLLVIGALLCILWLLQNALDLPGQPAPVTTPPELLPVAPPIVAVEPPEPVMPLAAAPITIEIEIDEVHMVPRTEHQRPPWLGSGAN